jgi:hypothetical protein
LYLRQTWNPAFSNPKASHPRYLALSSRIFTADYVNTVHPCPQTQTWWVRVSLTNKSNSNVVLKSCLYL